MNSSFLGYKQMTKYFIDVTTVTANDMRDTYHAYNPEIPTGKHIDYCFINKKVLPVSQRMMDDSVDGKYPSDHFGIFSVVEI